MGSFDFDKFIEALRKHLGEGEHDKIIDEIIQAWQKEEKDALKKKSLELLENHRLRLSGPQPEVLKNLHKKIKKGKKGGIGKKLKSRHDGPKSKIQQLAHNETDENDSEQTDTDTIDSSENVITGSIDEKNNEDIDDVATSTNGMSRTQNDTSETKEEHGQDNESKKRKGEMEFESQKEQANSEQVHEALRIRNNALEVEKKNLEESNRSLEDDLERKKFKLETERGKIEKLNNRLEEMEKSMVEKNAELKKTNEECDELGKQLESRNSEVESLSAQLNAIKQEKEKLSSDNTALVADKDKALERNRRLEDDLKRMSSKLDKDREDSAAEVTRLNARLEKMKRSMEKKNAALERSKTSLGEMDDKNKELATRLSAVAGAKLQHNNPNISDLSDKDRPTKLSEKYSELYDNEWTNAFTALENSNWGTEEEIIKRLLELLTDCFTECQSKAKEHLDQVKAVLLSPAGATIQNTDNEKTKKKYSFTEIQEKSITDLVKQTADVSYGDLFQVILDRHVDLSKKTEVKQYIRGCTELCWKMAVQTPPLYLSIFGWENEKFIKQFFKEYTKVGARIAFVVWPPLYLHQNGPLLCKGTAQGGD